MVQCLHDVECLLHYERRYYYTTILRVAIASKKKQGDDSNYLDQNLLFFSFLAFLFPSQISRLADTLRVVVVSNNRVGIKATSTSQWACRHVL